MAPLPPLGSSAPAGDPKLDPSLRSKDYSELLPYWTLVDDLAAGVDAMRLKRELYLPRFQEEKPKSQDSTGAVYDPYELRLAKAPLTNIFDDIWRDLSSKPFAKELTLKEGSPQQYKTFAENVDANGNNIHVFGQEMFKWALGHSITWLLVDYTKAMPRPDNKPLSKADERDQGLRPYWVWIPATRMLAAYSAFDGKKEIITHARIFEPTVVLDGYQEVVRQRIRILDREIIGNDPAGTPNAWGAARFVVWEYVPATEASKEAIWTVVDVGELSIGYIPLIPLILGDRTLGSFKVAPPLRNLANMQVTEYQDESNLQSICEQTCFPMHVIIGRAAPTDGNLVVGPRTAIFLPPSQNGTQGDAKTIEPTGSSVQIVVNRLLNTRTEMRDLGAQPLVQTNLTVITTGQVAVKANSRVQAWAIKFKDALEQALKMTAAWMGDLAYEPEVVVHMDYGAGMDNGEGFKGVMELRKKGDVSRETAIGSAQRYNYLPADFDIEKDTEQLDTEKEELQSDQPIDPITGKPLANVIPIRPGGPQPPRNANGGTQ